MASFSETCLFVNANPVVIVSDKLTKFEKCIFVNLDTTFKTFSSQDISPPFSPMASSKSSICIMYFIFNIYVFLQAFIENPLKEPLSSYLEKLWLISYIFNIK